MKIHLHVKFRAFGRDLAAIDERLPLPTEVQLALSVANVKSGVWFNDRGVLLELVED